MLTMIAVALLLQATPAPPEPPTRTPRPRVKVHAPEAPRWNPRRDRDEEDLTRDTTFAVRQGQRLEVNNFGGSITVSAWNEDRVRVVASGAGDPFQVESGSISIEVTTSEGRYGGPGESDLTISVPAWMALELSGNEVDISVRGLRSGVQANTVDGRIVIDGGEGNVEANSVEGDVTISNVRGRVQLNTVEGAVTLTNITGSALEASTVDGDIEMTGIAVPDVSANTVDGDISWSGALAPTGTYHFATHDGDLLLRLPGEPDATVSVDTYEGALESDWPVTLNRTQRRRMTFTLGAGRARLELSSFDGTISLKRGLGR